MNSKCVNIATINTSFKEMYDEDLARCCLDFAIREGVLFKVRLWCFAEYVSIINVELDKVKIFPGKHESDVVGTFTYPLVSMLRKKLKEEDKLKTMIITVKIFVRKENLLWSAKVKIGKDGKKRYFDKGLLQWLS